MNATAPKKSLGKSVGKVAAMFVVLFAIGFAIYTWITLSYSYAAGERAGFMQKLSHKGWIQDMEGELSLVALPGAVPEKFIFSIRDDAVAARVNELAGQRVVLHYEQHKGIPSSCFGETEYFVTDAKLIAEAAIP